MGSSDDMQAGTREGRVQICINNAWGRVCNTLFGREDAAVVCEQLEGFQKDGESCMVVIHAYVISTQMHACKLGNVASCANIFEQLHVENGFFAHVNESYIRHCTHKVNACIPFL